MRNNLFTLFLFYALVAMQWGCSRSRPHQYTIGVSQCVGGAWREKVNREMLSAQHLYDTDVRVVIMNADNNTRKQRQQIDSLLNSDIDLLIISPNEYKALAPSVERAHSLGVPVILFERKTSSKNYTAFIGGDNVEAGRAMGRYASKLCRDSLKKSARKPVVLQITGHLDMSPDRERYEGFAYIMARHPEIDYRHVQSNWSFEDAYGITRLWLKQGKPLDVVFCQSDLASLGAYKAAKELGKEKSIRFLGVDALPAEGIKAIQQGKLAASYVYPTQGEKIIALALDILQHKPYRKDNILNSIVVTPQNVDEIAMNANTIMEQSQYLITIQNKLEDYLGLYHTQRTLLWLALVVAFALLVAMLLAWRAIVVTHKANHRMKVLNEEQTRFYDNASHQLRTPLTLIQGPLSLLAKYVGKDDLEARKLLDIITRNTNELFRLVTDVLHFQKSSSMQAEAEALPDARETSRKAIQGGQRELVLRDQDDELATVLVVDDNADMRNYLRTLLIDRYFVIEAADGQSGIKLARECVPDLVVSDVMMPVMDGLTFCSKLKADPLTSHIPVVLLTARSTGAQQVQGFSRGADAYLIKPFDADVLLAQIDSLLANRQQLRKVFGAGKSGNGSGKDSMEEQEPSTPDKMFMDTLRDSISHNMGNAKLKMDDLGADMGISRVQLYRKVKAMTGMSPVELLRQMRLQKAYKLLQSTDKTIAEVAYEVGFGTPGYFSSCFKKQYGKYPTDIKKATE